MTPKNAAVTWLRCLLIVPAVAGAQDHPAWTRRGRVVWGGNLHEPLAFYRRENRLMAGVAAQGLWLDEWYRKVRREQTMKRLADPGVNVLYVKFAKRAGDAVYEDRAGTTRLVAICPAPVSLTVSGRWGPILQNSHLWVTS